MPTEASIWTALATVGDPEYPLSIVDLGMVYEARVAGGVVEIDMTFTSIGCPAIDMIVSDVRDAVAAVPGVEDIRIDILWDPPWTKQRISERGRRVLAVYGVVS